MNGGIDGIDKCEGTGCQSWCPMTIIVRRAVRIPILGTQSWCPMTGCPRKGRNCMPFLKPKDRPGASPRAHTQSWCSRTGPGAPGLVAALDPQDRPRALGRTGRDTRERREGKGTGCQSWRPRTILAPSPSAPGPPGSQS